MSFIYNPNYSSITNEVVSSRAKLNHNFRLGVLFPTKKNIRGGVYLGLFNAGEVTVSDFSGLLGIDKVKFIYRSSYASMSLSLDINLGKFYIHPSVSIAYFLQNREIQLIVFEDGSRERMIQEQQLIGDVRLARVIFPFHLDVGRTFSLWEHSFRIGLSGYYTINKFVLNVPRNAHFYGWGISVGIVL